MTGLEKPAMYLGALAAVCRQRSRRLLATALALGLASAAAALAADSWKDDGLPGFFRCRIPQGWHRRAPSFQATGIETIFTDGISRIYIGLYGSQGKAPGTPAEFLSLFEAGRKFSQSEPAEVSGRLAERFTRQYSVRLHPRDGGREEWLYEEVVFLPAPEGFWVLRFSSSSVLFRAQPRGLDIWRRFLESFELL